MQNKTDQNYRQLRSSDGWNRGFKITFQKDILIFTFHMNWQGKLQLNRFLLNSMLMEVVVFQEIKYSICSEGLVSTLQWITSINFMTLLKLILKNLIAKCSKNVHWGKNQTKFFDKLYARFNLIALHSANNKKNTFLITLQTWSFT